jgi:hypothetical protein
MPRVGKVNLTPDQKKRTFHLPVQQSIIVPSTSGVKEQRNISQAEMNKRVNNVRTYLSNKFGGYTSVKATGGFVLRNGKLVKEPVVKVTSFATKQAFKKNEADVVKQVGVYGRRWKQESVSYVNEGDLYIIEPPKNGAVKTMKKVGAKRMSTVKVPTRKRRMTTAQRRQMINNLAKARAKKKRR